MEQAPFYCPKAEVSFEPGVPGALLGQAGVSAHTIEDKLSSNDISVDELAEPIEQTLGAYYTKASK